MSVKKKIVVKKKVSGKGNRVVKRRSSRQSEDQYENPLLSQAPSSCSAISMLNQHKKRVEFESANSDKVRNEHGISIERDLRDEEEKAIPSFIRKTLNRLSK